MLKNKIKILLENWSLTVDKTVLAIYFIFLAIGSVSVFTSSSVVATKIDIDNFYFFKHQIIFAILSSCMLLFLSFLSETTLKKSVKVLFIVSFILLLSVHFFGFQTKGAKRWIYIFGFSMQPTEILKPILIILNAYLLEKFNDTKNIKFLIITIVLYLICTFLIYKQPDIGTLILLTLSFFTQIFLLDFIKIRNSIFIGIFVCVLFLLSYFTLPHVNSRINNFILSLKDPTTTNYQVKMSINSYKHSGILGRGFLEGEVKDYIPDSHTDFIFPAITEEFGFIIAFLIISLYFYLFFRVIIKANLDKEDIFKFLSLYGLSTLILFQAVINIGVSLNVLPTKGMTLPLLSYGGSSLIGTSLNIAMIIILTKKSLNTDMSIENSIDLSYLKEN